MTLDGGRIIDSSKRPLATNYLVFSVTPGQLAEEDATLAAASGINAGLLQALRRSPEELKQALADIDTHAAKLTEAIIKARAEAEARKLAQRAQAGCNSCAWFEGNFERLWGVITQGLDQDDKTLADGVKVAVLERWRQKPGWPEGEKRAGD
jgi:hypothetical protein